jgi:hypothetical protein
VITSASAISPKPVAVIPQAIPSLAASTVKPAEPAPKGPSLGQLLGITESQEMRIQDLVEQIRKKWTLNGVLIATSDGLPIVSSLSDDIDMHIWSRIAPLLFRKLDIDESANGSGKAHRSIVSSGGLWYSIYHEAGIFLILIHSLDMIQPQFEERNISLIREISRQHQKQLKTA